MSVNAVSDQRRVYFSDTVGLDDSLIFNDKTNQKTTLTLLKEAILNPQNVYVLEMYLDAKCLDYLQEIQWPFEKFKNLRSLSLGGLSTIQWMVVLEKVKDFDNLHHLKSWNVNIPTFKNLWTLELSADDTSSINSSIFLNNIGLRVLRIDGGKIIPNEIRELKGLQFLEIQSAFLEVLPNGLCDLTSLLQLKIYSRVLKGLPECIGNLSALVDLTVMTELSNVDFRTLPKSFASLHNLVRLEIHNANFQHFPDLLCQLKNIGEITIAVDDVRYVPKDIGNLKKITLLQIKKRGSMNSKTVKRTSKKLRKLFPGAVVDVTE